MPRQMLKHGLAILGHDFQYVQVFESLLQITYQAGRYLWALARVYVGLDQ